MKRYFKPLACLAVATSWAWAVPLFAGDIFVYQAKNGSRLITDHPRIEPGYRLIKVYSESKIWHQTSARPQPSIKPRPSVYDGLISKVAYEVNLDPLLIKSVMHAESGFNPKALSRKGASGLMQLMPGTAERYGVSRIFDPHQNVMGGALYLSDLIDKFQGDLQLVLAGYNAGENAVLDRGGIPPYPETQRYVKKVLGLYRKYQNQGCEQQMRSNPDFAGKIISCSASSRDTGTTISNRAISNVDVSIEPTLSSADDNQWRSIE